MPKKIIWAVLLSGAAQAGSASVALVTTAPNVNAWEFTDIRGRHFRQTRLTSTDTFSLEVDYGGRDLSRAVDTVMLTAPQDYLFPEDFGIFKAAVLNVAHACFNLSPSRDTAIVAALNKMNGRPRIDGYIKLGPVTLSYDRRIHAMGTSVTLFREGTPGVAPWNSSCTD